MKIKTKLIILVAIALVGMISIGALGIYSAEDSDATIVVIHKQRLPKIMDILNLSRIFSDLRLHSYILLSRESMTGNAGTQAILSGLEPYRASVAEAEKVLADGKAAGFHPRIEPVWDDFYQKWDSWVAVAKKDIETADRVARNPSPEALDKLFRQVEAGHVERRPDSAAIIKNIGEIIRLNEELSNETISASMDKSKTLERTQYAVIILMLALAGSVGFSMFRSVVKPLEEARDVVQRVATEHNLQLRVNLHSKDEVGDMVTGFNQMMARLQEALQSIQKKAGEVDEAVISLSTAADQVAQSSSSQSSSTSSMAASIEEMSVSISSVSGSAGEAQGQAQTAGKLSDEG